MKTINQVITEFQKYEGISRKRLPWLKGRTDMLDCAAGVSYILGVKPEIISCRVFKEAMIQKKVWKTTGIPKKGDLVIFDWTSGRKKDTAHIGIVIIANKNVVKYISADSGDHMLVTENTVGYNYVTGFGSYYKYALETKK
jgi:hypothetical protein